MNLAQRARRRGGGAGARAPGRERARPRCRGGARALLRAGARSRRHVRRRGRARRPALSSAGWPTRCSSAAADRADRDPQPHRLDGAPDDARRGRPADRRLRRLPRGARRGRCRPDLHRGHRRAPERPAHGPHDRRLRPARGRAARARGRRRARRRRAALRAALPWRPRADRRPAARAGGRALGGAEPALQGRAARAQLGRDRGDHRASRARGRPRARGRAGRHRAVRLARLPADAVPERAHEPPRRRLGRRCRAAPALRARGTRARCGAAPARARRGHPALGRRDAARGPPRPGDGRDPVHARRRRADRLRERRDRRLGELPRSAWIVPPPPVARDSDAAPGGDPARAAERAADRHLAHPRARRGRGAAGRGRGRRRRHDARADRRPRPPAAHRGGPRGRAHPLHRLQSGLHRPLPPRHGDLVPPESAHRPRADRCRSPCRRRDRACSSSAAAPPAWPPPWPRRGGRRRHAGRGAVPRWAASSRSPAARPRIARRPRRYAADWARRLAAAGVDVRLDTRVARRLASSPAGPIA